MAAADVSKDTLMKKKNLKANPGKQPVQKTSSTANKNHKMSAAKTSGQAHKFAAEATIMSQPHKAQLRHIPWSTVAIEELNPLLGRQFVVGQNVMLARVLLQKGCVVPEHSHHNEQITYILAGALKFGIDGKEIVVNAGEVLTIPPNMPHWAEALADTVDLDIFNPPRADWINKTDSYLR
jgi:quercetin dioxygenase-like cupin family protein